MPANRVPDAGIQPIDRDGKFTPVWWRFFARLAGQFSGADAPLMPVDAAGVLSIAEAQAKPHGLSEGQVQEIAQQVLLMLPRVVGKDRETADDALIALANRPVGSGHDSEARDLAAIALSRNRPQRLAQPQILFCTQATFPASATLSPNTLIVVTDFAHTILWDGAAFSFMDGGSDYYVVAPSAPSGVGWHAVDGSTVNYLNADGTVTAKTLRNVAATPAYLKVGAGADTLNAPVVPTIPGQPLFTSSETPGNILTKTPVLVDVAVPSHSVLENAAIDLSLLHRHQMANITVNGDGEPENFYSQLWFRL